MMIGKLRLIDFLSVPECTFIRLVDYCMCMVYSQYVMNYCNHYVFLCRLLQDNPDLYQLYKDLVVGDIITAEEFWANRSNGQVQHLP